jgi:cytochrome c oxidase subunit 2
LTAAALQRITPQGAVLTEMSWVLIVGAALVFLFVMGLLARALRPRRREASTALWVVGGGLLFPVGVLSALLVYTTVRSAQLAAERPGDSRVIGVVGRMWWWELRYRDPASGREVLAANELRVPVGRPVTLGLTSGDVIHSFWVPALGGKVDMVPGRVHQLRFTVREAGSWRGQCAEYCGAQHAKMALPVVAMPPAEFDAWLAAQARPAASPADALAARGREVFIEQRCAACHTVRGMAEESALGPDLTHLGSRLTLAAGELPMGEDALRRWIADPQAVKPGARMPAYDRLDDDSLRALSAWLLSLR